MLCYAQTIWRTKHRTLFTSTPAYRATDRQPASDRPRADRWLATHPGGTVTYRDLAEDPPPHFAAATGRRAGPRRRARPSRRSRGAHRRVGRRDHHRRHGDPRPAAVQLRPAEHGQGLARSHDRPGLVDRRRNAADFWATPTYRPASRGGGYGPGTPREGWDHAQPWLPHAAR